jgi:uncharacterized FlaG/YvyC family protein
MKTVIKKLERRNDGFAVGFEVTTLSNVSFYRDIFINVNEASDEETAVELAYNKLSPALKAEYDRLSLISKLLDKEVGEDGKILKYIWHEESKPIQVKMSYDNTIKMLNDVPELGMYKKMNGIVTYLENGITYFYLNYFNEGHQELLLNYGAAIEDKSAELL